MKINNIKILKIFFIFLIIIKNQKIVYGFQIENYKNKIK